MTAARAIDKETFAKLSTRQPANPFAKSERGQWVSVEMRINVCPASAMLRPAESSIWRTCAVLVSCRSSRPIRSKFYKLIVGALSRHVVALAHDCRFANGDEIVEVAFRYLAARRVDVTCPGSEWGLRSRPGIASRISSSPRLVDTDSQALQRLALYVDMSSQLAETT